MVDINKELARDTVVLSIAIELPDTVEKSTRADVGQNRGEGETDEG